MRSANACSDIMEEDSNVSSYSYSRSSTRLPHPLSSGAIAAAAVCASSSARGDSAASAASASGGSCSIAVEQGEVRFTIDLPGELPSFLYIVLQASLHSL